jgi:hypothetical protein
VSALSKDLSRADPERRRRFFFLFLSFNLVNSTAFKTISRAWHVVIRHLYELVVKELRTKCEGIKVWKYVGDEVLIYKQITNLGELSKDIPKVFHVCRSVSRAVQNSFDQARIFLSVKATVWIARAAQVPPQDINELKQQQMGGHLKRRLSLQISSCE